MRDLVPVTDESERLAALSEIEPARKSVQSDYTARRQPDQSDDPGSDDIHSNDPSVILPQSPSTPGHADMPDGMDPHDFDAVRIYSNTVKGDPTVETDVHETEEVLDDGTVVRHRLITTATKQTVTKYTVAEGPEGSLPGSAEEVEKLQRERKGQK